MAPSQGVARPALGLFQHEAACVDKVGQRVYLTEDAPDGRLYRFAPTTWPDLSRGVLRAASVGPAPDYQVRWVTVDATRPQNASNRPPGTTAFNGGEGCWFKGGLVYFTTKGTNQVFTYDTTRKQLRVLYDDDEFRAMGLTPPLTGVDNITVVPRGDVYVAEDGGDMQLIIITPEKVVAPVLQVTGQDGSEIAGPAFDPSRRRLYFSSQRGGTNGLGITYEVQGPFR
jgi:secreted PhoX family phosphatase